MEVQEQLEFILEEFKEELTKKASALSHQYAQIRTGQPNSSLLDGIMVEYYGSMTPLTQIANAAPDGTSLRIKPFDKSSLDGIVKAIFESDLGITPNNTGDVVILNFPPLTQERRNELVKDVKRILNDFKSEANKSTRHKALDAIRKVEGIGKDDEKRYEDQVDVIKNEYFKKFEEIAAEKEKDIKF